MTPPTRPGSWGDACGAWALPGRSGGAAILLVLVSVASVRCLPPSPRAAEVIQDAPHRRYNPLLEEWVLCSPHRTRRPWSGQVEDGDQGFGMRVDRSNPLAPGGRRGGTMNPDYESVFIFNNDFPALLPDTPVAVEEDGPLFRSHTVRGRSRVMCFHPYGDLTLALMTAEEVHKVVDAWADETETLGREYQWVQVFENRGAMMGCSNPHPHCQIWASDFVPNIPAKKDASQRRYYERYGSVLLVDYAREEKKKQVRVVDESDHWICVVPYWAMWPYEIMMLPKRHVLRLPDLSEKERRDLAVILKRVLTRYDNLFEISMPYSMGWHGAPFPNPDESDEDWSHWQLHAVYYPPLLRSATVKKFMVGYEMMAEAQRDLTPEMAAARLREQNATEHFRPRDPPITLGVAAATDTPLDQGGSSRREL